ncbi:hypothetical protein OH77DRAFT_1150699 [Trametes cingulata]|nr:hypothetical protein OH77DRAFT_1150699 [Trametes cingulata]
MDALPKSKPKQMQGTLLQPRTPQLIGRPRQRSGANTVSFAFRSVSYREEKAARRLEMYGDETEKEDAQRSSETTKPQTAKERGRWTTATRMEP